MKKIFPSWLIIVFGIIAFFILAQFIDGRIALIIICIFVVVFTYINSSHAKDGIPEIGQEISRKTIVNHAFKILEFDRNGTIIKLDNQIKAKSLFKPYGYLIVESPILGQRAKMPIIHRDDFLLAASIFDDTELLHLIADEDFIVVYSPKELLADGLSGSPHHVLHYAIVPHGTLHSYYSMDNDIHVKSPDPKKLFGQFIYEGEIKVQIDPRLIS